MNTHGTISGVTPTKVLREKVSQAYACQSREGAEERWILDNLPMVRHIAHKVAPYLSGNVVEMEDLISAGTIGLVKAARAYDPEKDTEFRTYAYIRVRGAIIDELRGRSFVPALIHGQVKHIQATYQRVYSQRGTPPGDAELADAAGISQEQLYRILQETRKQTFLSIHGLSQQRPAMEAIILVAKGPAPDTQAERNELLARLSKAIQGLPKRDRTILLLYYERDLTMKEIAKTLTITESRVSQLHASALFRLSMSLR